VPVLAPSGEADDRAGLSLPRLTRVLAKVHLGAARIANPCRAGARPLTWRFRVVRLGRRLFTKSLSICDLSFEQAGLSLR
jgi:hypothetical protein